MMSQRYEYVGPNDLLALLDLPTDRQKITTVDDLRLWLPSQLNQLCRVTFTIDQTEALWVADRHSEHIVCASGNPVLAAGEMAFEQQNETITVVEITNQSTGFCPKPESWDAVATALDKLTLPHPPFSTTTYTFRRCDHCSTISIIKDNIYECAVCERALSQAWNFYDRNNSIRAAS